MRPPLELWQEIERVLVAGEPLTDDLRDRLSLLAQAIILLADDRRLEPTRAATEAAKLAGLTGLDIEGYRLARRERPYGELYQLELRLLAEAKARGDKRGGIFTGERKATDVAAKLGKWAGGASKGTIQRWAGKLPKA